MLLLAFFVDQQLLSSAFCNRCLEFCTLLAFLRVSNAISLSVYELLQLLTVYINLQVIVGSVKKRCLHSLTSYHSNLHSLQQLTSDERWLFAVSINRLHVIDCCQSGCICCIVEVQDCPYPGFLQYDYLRKQLIFREEDKTSSISDWNWIALDMMILHVDLLCD